MNVRRLTYATVGVALAAGVAGCGTQPAAPAGPATSDAVISIGIGEPKHGLVPSDTAETQGQLVLTSLFTPLAKVDSGGKVTEVAADSITTSDNKVWTIKLKDGYTFHNGEKVTSDSYIEAWNRAAYKPNEQDGNYLFAKIDGYDDVNPAAEGATPKTDKLKGLKKVDDLTFQVTLSAPYVAFKAVLVNLAFAPLPKVAFKGTGFDKAFGEAPIGDGPFAIKGGWRHNQSIEVARYDAFPGEKPKVKGILFHIYPDLDKQYADLVAGKVDIAPVLPLPKLEEAKRTLGERYKQSPRAGIGSLGFPSFDPKYASTDARKAISMAIDREQIVKTVFDGTRTPAHSFLQPGIEGYRADSCGEACRFDPVKAKELFTRSGFTGPVELTFNVDGGSKDWVDAVCGQIKTNLGVDCVEKPIEKYADLLTKLKAHAPGLGVFRSAWTYDYPAPESILGPLYTCASTSNYYGYCNAQVDRLIAAGDVAPNPDEAVKSYQQAEDIIAHDLPTVPLWYLQHVYGLGTKVKNVEVNDLGMVDFVKVEAA
ncbi:peptide ABC transporter substrate-binding protein [Amycolatopsis vastitatis]|uniref:4-phytase n=1 Tax=Amycolatopsis vastitatis TaxID=1905142 RepID=A0A229SZK6_9PSEU|nr:ABC transporter substrate-binding protein [Amycolatopsis vastitatis]OXM64180.1 4-phytase [Amycolatopsis vastitatis]